MTGMTDGPGVFKSKGKFESTKTRWGSNYAVALNLAQEVGP